MLSDQLFLRSINLVSGFLKLHLLFALLGVDSGAQFFADELELSGEGVERVVLVTDGAGYAGSRKISDAPQSATFIDAHGMGCLTSEVLANIAIKAGSRVTIIHGEAHSDERVRQAVLDALD